MQVNEIKLRETIETLKFYKVCPDTVTNEKCDKSECSECWIEHLKEQIW